MPEQPPRDLRPRPEYGEYASPQDQASAIAGSQPPVSPFLVPGNEAKPGPTPAASGWPAVTPPKASTGERPRRRWDLILSVGLLSYGLITVMTGFVQYSDVASIINQAYEIQGVGAFTSTDSADTVGTAAIFVNVVLYAITAAITIQLLRRRRLAFYVPIIGGALSAIIIGIMIVSLMLGDPAFTEYMNNAG